MIRYWIERFPATLFGPAAAVIALAAQDLAKFSLLRWSGDVLQALLLLAQFRLWDDLADRERDRTRHPHRVLVRAESTRPFVIVCLALGTINLVIAASTGRTSGVALFAVLNTAFAAWYAWRPAGGSAASSLVLLTKYPSFVLVIAAGAGSAIPHAALGVVTVYASALAYEIWHDAASPLRFTNS